VRIPSDYRFWIDGFAYLRPDEAVFAAFDGYLAACRERGLHMSLNLHRAPSYCINRNDLERDNLWLDQVAQRRPVRPDPRRTRRAHRAHRRRDPGDRSGPRDRDRRPGRRPRHLAMPELAGLGVTHSGRGYQPMPVSHHRASWWPGHADAPPPEYPGRRWEGRVWDRATLREFYRPWREVEAAGAAVHIGECGCYNKTPNDIALRWLGDLFGLYREFGWGFALWNFAGDFGIVNHGRPGARYEQIGGFKVDRDLLEILLASRT